MMSIVCVITVQGSSNPYCLMMSVVAFRDAPEVFETKMMSFERYRNYQSVDYLFEKSDQRLLHCNLSKLADASWPADVGSIVFFFFFFF